MGGMFESKQSTNSTQSTQVPLNFSQLMDRTISFANQGLDTPFQAYNNPRIAELSANEQAGIGAAGAQAGMYQPLIDMAMANNADMQAKGGIPNATDLGQFINPYVDYVLNNSLSRLNEQSDTNMTKIGSTAAMQGAFGGTRHGVLEGANLAELLKSSGELSANTYSDAFDKGMGNWFRSQDLRRGTIRDALDITGQGSQYNRNDINTLMQTGLVGRTRDQSVLDFDFSEFMREQQDPFTKAGFASSILSSYPTNLFTRNTKSETTNSPSPFSQIAGIGLAAAGLMTGNPAAAAGLMAGQQSLGMGSPIGGVDLTGPGGVGNGAGVAEYEALLNKIRGGGLAKGGKVSGYKKGGAIKKSEYVAPLDLLDEKALERLNQYEKNAYSFDLPEKTSEWFRSFVGGAPTIFGPEEPAEKRARTFTDKVGKGLNSRALERLILDDKLKNTLYLDDPLGDAFLNLAKSMQDAENETQAKWNAQWAPIAHRELGDMTVPTDASEDFLTPYESARRTKRVKGYPQRNFAFGGEVPGTMVEAFNSQRQPQGSSSDRGGWFGGSLFGGSGTLFGGSVLDAIFGTGRYEKDKQRALMRGGTHEQAPRPTQRPMYDWSAFRDVQGLDRLPTAQSNVNPNYATGQRPDLSMFMQALQQRISGQPQQGGTLPTPPFQTQGFAEGGKIYLKNKPSTDVMTQFLKEMGFTEPTGVDQSNIPLDYLIDKDRVFRLALQKHETGVKKYDEPNYLANSFKGKDNSHAFGLGQWQPSVWNTMATKWNREHPNDPVGFITQEDVKADKLPPKVAQDKIWSIWEKNLLRNQNNDPILAFAEHQLGAGDLSKILKVDKNRKIADVVGPQIAKNVSAKNETIQQYLDRLNSYVKDADSWERSRLAQLGGNLTDRIRGEGGDPTYESFNEPKQAVKTRRRTLNEADIKRALNHDAYNAWRQDAENEQIHKPNNENVLMASTTDGRVDRVRPGPVDPLAFLAGRPTQQFFQGMNFTRPQDLPTQYRNPTFGEYLTPEEEEAINRKLGGAYSGGGYVKKFASGGSPDEEETLAQKRYRDAVNAARRGVGQEDLPSGYWGDPLSSVADQLGTQGVNELDHIWGSDTTPYTAKSILGKFGDLGGRSLASIIPGLKLAGSTIPNALSALFENDGSMGKTPTPSPAKPPSPFGSLNMGEFRPDNEGTTAEEFNTALTSGEPSDIVSGPMQEQVKEDGLTTALKSMIMQEIENRKNYKEPGNPTLFGREINMPLLKMGLGILANSGYPNSAGEAIGKGVLGALSEEEQKQLDKQKRNSDKLKELLNLRYMQGMVESMDPNVRMQLAREKQAAELSQLRLQKDLEYIYKMQEYPTKLQFEIDKAKAIAEINNPFLGTTAQEETNVD